MPSSSSSSSSSGGGAAATLCAFAAGGVVGAAGAIVYANRRLGARLPAVPADSPAAPYLSLLPERLLEYMPFSVDGHPGRRPGGALGGSGGGPGGASAAALDEGAAPATPTAAEAVAAQTTAAEEEEVGGGTAAAAAAGGPGAAAALPPPPPAPPIARDARAPSDLLLPLALTQRVDGNGGGAGGDVRSMPLLGELSESSALATPRAAAAAAAGKGARHASSSSLAVTAPPPPPSEYKLALVVRGDLRWPRQKTAVMCSHASIGAWKRAWKASSGGRGGGGGGGGTAGSVAGAGGGDSGTTAQSALARWEREKSPKVVLRAEDEAALEGVLEAAKAAGLPTHAMSEVTPTAGGGGSGGGAGGGGEAHKSRVILAIGPAPSEAINAVLGGLKLL